MHLLRRLALPALICAGVAAIGAPRAVRADESPKNLKVLPSTLSRAEVKKIMKGIAKSLGVECDHCHNTDDFAEDSDKKNAARAMMRMVGEINKTYFKGKPEVGCVTCHNGHKEPKKPGA